MSNKVGGFKVHLVGNSQVGKTSIMEKYCEDRFQETIDQWRKDKKVRYKQKCEIEGDTIRCLDMTTCHKEDKLGGKFKNSDACMIVAASDSRESFDSIDKWSNMIRTADEKERPICLLLVNFNEEDESKMAVTEAMIKKKCLQSGFEAAIKISNKAMTQS